MKARISIIACLMAVLGFAACGDIDLNEIDEEGESMQYRTMSFKLYADAKTGRASTVSDFRHIIVVDIVDGNVAQVIRQSKSDKDFGTPKLTLSKGEHTLRFLATDADIVQKGEKGEIISQNPLGDTFLRSLAVNTETSSKTQKVVLERYVARIINKRKESVTIQQVFTDMDLNGLKVTGQEEQVSLDSGSSVMTFVPASGALAFSDGKRLPVARNQITVVTPDGTSGGVITMGETLAMTNDTAAFYVAEMEIGNVVLSKIPDPCTHFAAQMSPYRVPTRIEAQSLQNFTLPVGYWSGTRCLCYDSPSDLGKRVRATAYGSGNWYTFVWEAGTNITRAGTKAAYCIKPIRHVPIAPIENAYTIDGDFVWGNDTIQVKSSHF